MDPLTPVLTVLSAMITPVVVIAACASLIISTSARGDRTVDRLYHWSEELQKLADASTEAHGTSERRAMIFQQLDHQTSQARLLQRSLAACYLALGLFVSTSVTIGLAALAMQFELHWTYLAALPLGLGLLGAGSLFYACLLLVAEARLALTATEGEMDFVWEQGKRYVPGELVARRANRQRRKIWRFGPPAETTRG